MQNLKWKILFIFLISVVTVSCTEEIAQELKDVDNQEAAAPTTSATNLGIRIVSKMNDGYSHIVHKEGSKATACEVVAPTTGWTAQGYTKSDATVAVDCVLEVEEQDLFWQDTNLEFTADNGMCEYVQYIPHRFFQYQPGWTTMQQYEFKCDTMCGNVNAAICADFADKVFKNYMREGLCVTKPFAISVCKRP